MTDIFFFLADEIYFSFAFKERADSVVSVYKFTVMRTQLRILL